MWKLLVIPMALFLSACKGDTIITVEDNSPDKYEREQAMRDCTGKYRIEAAEYEIRLNCTQAIYGGKQ